MARTGVSWHHLDWPEGSPQANNSIAYRFWMPGPWKLCAVQAYIQTVNTEGTHTIAATESSGTLSVLTGANFDLTTLVAATATNLVLTGTAATLEFVAGEILTLTVTSNDDDFDGSGLYFGIMAQEH
tara:strand:+ start:173 stop:553 length:381 start_codon:yes stop_codon:yes gene_type:complete